jgi:hypothetical protein
MLMVAWNGDTGVCGMVLNCTVTAFSASSATDTGHFSRLVRSIAQGRATSITIGAPWKPLARAVTCDVT